MKILKKLWGVWFYVSLVLIFLFFYPAFFVMLSRRKWYRWANKLRRVWSKSLFFSLALFPRVVYQQKLDKDKVYIFCTNHSSYLDIPLFFIGYKGYSHFMAKKELAQIPVFGIFFRTIDITVDRSSKISSFKAFEQAKKNLKNKENLVIFPEGRTSDIAPRLLKFKKGAFRLAIENKIPIVPVTFLDNWRLFPEDGKHMGRPGVTRVIFHKPIDTNNLTKDDVEMLSKKVYETIDSTLKKVYESK